MSSEAAYEVLIGKYLSGNIDPLEKQELFAWVEATAENRAFFDQMVSLWSMTSEYEEEPFEANFETAWGNIENSISVAEEVAIPEVTLSSSAKVVRISVWQRVLRVAAILLPLIAAGYWLFVQSADPTILLATGDDEILEYELPDGSKIWLNENSQLSFDSVFDNRMVVLDGEAFFDITKRDGKKFEILSGEAKTTVFGTSFNVRAYPKEDLIEVTVESGVVELSKTEAPAEKVKLTKGNSGLYKKKEEIVEREAKGVINASSWKTKVLDFEERPISQVLISLERYFQIDFEVANPDILKCNFKINNLRNPDIQTIKELIEFETNGEIRLVKKGTTYVFEGKGC